MIKLKQIFVTFIGLSWLLVSFSATAQLPDNLDEFIEKVVQDFGIAGLSVSVVKDDKVVYAKGFGVREIGKPTKVDENTLFAIGSNTKAFTSASLGMLIDDGKMSWDDKVTQHLPWFELYDPYVTREITVRDILSHRSGLGGEVILTGLHQILAGKKLSAVSVTWNLFPASGPDWATKTRCF